MNRVLQMRVGDLVTMKRGRQNQDLDPGHPSEAYCSFGYSPLPFLHILGRTRLPPSATDWHFWYLISRKRTLHSEGVHPGGPAHGRRILCSVHTDGDL